MINDLRSLRHRARRRSRLQAAIFGATACVALLPGVSRAGDGDGLLVQRYYETRQIDCARRWRDHPLYDMRTLNCIGYDGATPFAARAALDADKQRSETAIASAPTPSGGARLAKLPPRRFASRSIQRP